MSRVAHEYYDAVMSGDTVSAERLKADLDHHTKLAQTHSTITPAAINTVLGDDRTPALIIYNFLNEKYGADTWWEWEIETIEQDLWKEYGLVLNDVMADKIQAIKYLLNSQRPFLDYYYFNNLACAFCGSIADFTTIKSPSPGMAIATMRTMQQIRPAELFSRDVKKYVSLLMINEGVYVPPPSIAEIIREEFEVLVSEETRKMWPDILKKASEMLNEKEYGDDETTVGIQARRLLVAEHSSNKFGG